MHEDEAKATMCGTAWIVFYLKRRGWKPEDLTDEPLDMLVAAYGQGWLHAKEDTHENNQRQG